MNKPNINDLEAMLKVIKDRIAAKETILSSTTNVENSLGRSNSKTAGVERGQGGKDLQEREREKRECWSGKCPSCNTFNEVENEDIRFESGFFVTPAGHYCECLHCSYKDVPVRNRDFEALGGEEIL